MRYQKYLKIIGITILAAILIFSPKLLNLLVEYLFFQEIGLPFVFETTNWAKIGLFVGGVLTTCLFICANINFAIRSTIPWVASVPRILTGGMNQVIMSKGGAKRLGYLIGGSVALIVGLILSASWQNFLLYMNQQPYGVVDPLFNNDISFYIFSLPIYELVLGVTKSVVMLTLIFCGVVYFIRGSLLPVLDLKKFSLDFKKIKPEVRWHIGILFVVMFLLSAFEVYLSRFGLLYKGSGVIYGATYTDVMVLLPILKMMLIVTGIIGLSGLFFTLTGETKYLMASVAIYLVLILGQGIAPELVQRFVVDPNELVRETPFLQKHISATREAYDLDTVETKQLTGDTELTRDDIANNDLTLKNVRLWDRAPLLSTFSQIQEIRTYYEFNSVTNDRYVIDGELRQLMLSPRELDSSSLPTQNWINSHLTFTHGYGITAGPVNQVTTEGLPVLFVQDIPPQTQTEVLAVDRPEIYYGMISNEYVVVNTKSQEFDYPKGDEQVYTQYEGTGGIAIDSLWKRIVYAIKFKSVNIILNADITDVSRIMYYRQVMERVQQVAPFLTYDHDPYMVVDDGRLYWVLDAYTSSSRFPYSQPVIMGGQRVNYMRNTVKVVVDAYDGTMTFYKINDDDPIINVYADVFDGMFVDFDQIPEGLKAHMRYPEDIFTVQTEIFSTFHMTEPQIFYNKEDQWEVPSILDASVNDPNQQDGQLAPRHMIMRLPDEENEEYILMLPFTPRAKDNLAAWMVARNDGDAYGKLQVYTFPKDKLVYGPRQVISRINQDADVSRQITLWDQRGSEVIQGPLLVIPIESSLIYVRPLYLKASDGKIPELKRTIVAYENKIAMGETLEGALNKIFRTDEETVSTVTEVLEGETDTVDPDIRAKIQRAQSLYDQALEAQQNGDWAEYGRLIELLGDVLSGI